MAAMSSPAAAVTEIAMPQNDLGIGSVIISPDSAELIDGVVLTPLALYPDDRGYFMEVARIGKGLVSEFPAESTQVSMALTYPGTIKAFHFHRKQTDYWVPASGMFQVALVDLRPESRTFGRRNTIYAGALRPWSVRIPPGVGHGYKVVGSQPGILVYVTDRHYDPSDEGRIAYNDPGIHYDWELQHK
jgi:dTDP-4-dehydrorhamnose 3,5-epimerase